MMRTVICKAIVVGLLISGIAMIKAPAANAQEDLQAASEIIRKQKKTYLEKIMELTPQEEEAFWPLYAEYESGLLKLRDKRLRLLTNYIQNHESVSDAEAIELVDQKLRMDDADLKFKQAYVAKFKQALPGRKVLRFYQAENRFDTAAFYGLYKHIPVIR